MSWRGLLQGVVISSFVFTFGCPAEKPAEPPPKPADPVAEAPPPGGSAASASSKPANHPTSSVAVDLSTFFVMPDTPTDAVAMVNEEVITRAALEDRLRQTQVQLDAAGLPDGLTRYDVLDGAVDDLIDDKVEIVLAKKLGAVIDPKAVDQFLAELDSRMAQNPAFQHFLLRAGKDEAQRKLDAIDAVRRRAIVDKIKQGAEKELEDAARAHYEKHKRDYLEKGGVQTWRIVIKAPRGMMQRDRDAARSRAENIYKKAKKDPKSFENLAKSYSEGGKRMYGGFIGYVGEGQFNERFEKAIYAGKPGQVLPLYEDAQGFQIIRVGERRKTRTIPFEERKDEIVASVYGSIIRQKVKTQLDDLRKAQKVQILIPELLELEAKRKKPKTN